MEEVAPMEIYTMQMQRPSLLPTAACAPSAPAAILASEWAVASQVHQVQIQAELSAALVGTDGSYESMTGFVGSNVATDLAAKRAKDGASGVPPRGRPV
jgi:hypothetical protein